MLNVSRTGINLVLADFVKFFCPVVTQLYASVHSSPGLCKNLPSNWKKGLVSNVRHNLLKKMANADPTIETVLKPLRAAVREQGDLVRSLKESGASDIDIKKAVLELKARKKILEDKELTFVPKDKVFERARMEDLLRRRFFFDTSFSIYGGISGQYDFGPMGCAMKHALLNEWRNHFVLEDHLLEVDCTILTPEPVLKASGHVERFADLMVKDLKTGECFRLDHLIKSHISKLKQDKNVTPELENEYEEVLVRLDGYGKDEMSSIVSKYNIKSPLTGNDLSEPLEFNLMFSTSIGPSGNVKAFLRPETAQGIFVNFKRLLLFNNGKLPFGVAQIGNSFRNEISPRSGLIRVREFTMAEIEYFVDPENKDHPKFTSVENLQLNLYSACNQMDGKSAEMTRLGDAVANKMIANQTLGYYIARIYQFMIRVGIDPQKLRFRQHMSNEMAHYACDCWDAECLTSYGWVECVGCADRSCYDLSQHTKATGIKLVAEKNLKEPITVDTTECVPQKAPIGKTYKTDAKIILEKLTSLTLNEQETLEKSISEKGNYELNVDGKMFNISKDMVSIRRYPKKVHVQEIVPSVIEPSFGIGRIMYSIWEHNFRIREESEERTYLTLPPVVAPVKCSVLPLSGHTDFIPFIQKISSTLRFLNISHKIDDSSGSIGRRYSRADEIAIPFGITIDFDTLKEPHTVTVRERDSTSQIRVSIDEVGNLIEHLCSSKMLWDDAKKIHPVFEHQEATKE